MILHIVLYQPRALATAEELSELAKAIETASREIPSIRQVRVGKAVDLRLGYNNWAKDRKCGGVAVFEFEDEKALSVYLAHPEHKRLAELFWRTCEETVIVDVSAVDTKAHSIDTVFG